MCNGGVVRHIQDQKNVPIANLPWHGGVFSSTQFSPVAVLCLLVQASLDAGQVYAQSSSDCEAVRVRQLVHISPVYIFPRGQRRMELCHHFGQPHAPKALVPFGILGIFCIVIPICSPLSAFGDSVISKIHSIAQASA